jgi:cytoskeletal protein RodZ
MDVGAALRHAREQKGLTLDRLSRVTRITLPILEAIERNSRPKIPPRPYGRAMVRAYASEVGLEPERTVSDFFAQFAPVPEPQPKSIQLASAPAPSVPRPSGPRFSQRPMVAVACAIALALVVGVWLAQRRSVPDAVGTSGGSSVPSAADSLGRNEPTTTAAPPSSPGVTVFLEATGPAWVTAVVDGRRAIYRTMQPGEREVLRGKQEIRLRTGNAGALRWQIDGRPAGVMGKSGQVRSARITPNRGRGAT